MKIKFLTTLIFGTILLSSQPSYAEWKKGKNIKAKKITQERHNKVCKYGIFNPPECKYKIVKQPEIENSSKQVRLIKMKDHRDCRWGVFNPPKCRGLRGERKVSSIDNYEEIKKDERTFDSQNNNISFYTGTFDVIDKEGDDKTSLMGMEHKNTDLFRDTFVGTFTPITGAFITGKNSAYLYTGLEGQYKLGPIRILPSFSPGYYEAGNGKNLGSALEFKSELKVGFDLFKGTKLGYSYSHISNNDWGDTNPGTDNQQFTLSKKF